MVLTAAGSSRVWDPLWSGTNVACLWLLVDVLIQCTITGVPCVEVSFRCSYFASEVTGVL